MTATEKLDIVIACKAEYPEYQITLKDLFQVRELMADVLPYAHPIRVSMPAPEGEPE